MARTFRYGTSKKFKNNKHPIRSKTDIIDFRVKSQNLSLQRHEFRKLSETLTEASTSALRAYELGLYL